MKAFKNFFVAALLTLCLVFFWQWRSRGVERREAEQALYCSYISGPLTDYCLGLTRSLPLIHGEKCPDLADAVKAAQASGAELQALIAAAPDSPSRAELEKALPYHLALPGQIAVWRAAKKEQWPQLRSVEEDSRDHLIFILETLRYTAFNQWKLNTQRKLEVNALIYSLKELSTKSPQ